MIGINVKFCICLYCPANCTCHFGGKCMRDHDCECPLGTSGSNCETRKYNN